MLIGSKDQIGTIRYSLKTAISYNSISSNSVVIPKRVFKTPVILRNRRPGDTIELIGGKTSVKKIFSDFNIPEEDRNLIPIIESKDGIIAVVSSVLNKKNIVSAFNNKINFLKAEDLVEFTANIIGDDK